jgi:glycosyltransferase involved in cell wall biosynthesis
MNLSVVIPLYNKERAVQRTIESVLNQTVLPTEIIVVDDGSTDGSMQVVEQLNHPLVRLVHQTNAGVSAARNKGIELAIGDWIAFLDADDLWDPLFLETILFLHSSYPRANVLATAYLFEDHLQNRKPVSLNALSFTGESGLLNNYFEVASVSNPPICSSAVVVKRRTLLDVGGFPVDVAVGEDLLMWAILASRFEIAYSTRPLSVFVLDPAHSYEGKPTRIPATVDQVGKRLRGLFKSDPDTLGLGSYVAHWHKMRASIYLRLGKRLKSAIEVFKSLRYAPNQPKLYTYLFLTMLPTSVAIRVFKRYGSA